MRNLATLGAAALVLALGVASASAQGGNRPSYPVQGVSQTSATAPGDASRQYEAHEQSDNGNVGFAFIERHQR